MSTVAPEILLLVVPIRSCWMSTILTTTCAANSNQQSVHQSSLLIALTLITSTPTRMTLTILSVVTFITFLIFVLLVSTVATKSFPTSQTKKPLLLFSVAKKHQLTKNLSSAFLLTVRLSSPLSTKTLQATQNVVMLCLRNVRLLQNVTRKLYILMKTQ